MTNAAPWRERRSLVFVVIRCDQPAMPLPLCIHMHIQQAIIMLLRETLCALLVIYGTNIAAPNIIPLIQYVIFHARCATDSSSYYDRHR